MSTPRGLFISAAVLALPKLTLTARLVLAEILNLHKVAGNVFARDSHFADRLNVGVRTVGTSIAELETQGYLTRPYDPAARQKRSLVITEKCLPILQGVVAKSASSVEECLLNQQPLCANQPESDCRNGNECLPILQGVVAESADINNIINNNPNTLPEGVGELASSASEGLDSQPASAPTVGPVQAEATTTPPRAGRAPRKRGATLPTSPAELLPTSCLLAELLNPGGLAAKVQQMTEPLTLTQAERLLLDFSVPVLREIFCEMANYRKLLTASTSANLTARNWLTRRGLKPSTQQPPLLIATTTSAAEEELDEPARLFRAEQAAREQAEQDAHFARWAARPTTATA